MNEEHTDILIKSNVLNEYPHPLPPLADMGVKVYDWDVRWRTFEDAIKEKAGARASGSMEAEQFSTLEKAIERTIKININIKIKITLKKVK